MLGRSPSPFSWEELRYAIAIERDTMAFKKLFLHFYKDLRIFGMGMIKSAPVVEDIIADIFLKVWSLEADLMRIDQMNTYLYKAVRNNAIKYLARLPLQVDISEIINFEYHVLTPEQVYISQEHITLIEAAIAQLPSKCRMAFTLVKDLDCSYKDAAEIMNISVHTVDRHMQLALKRLREVLGSKNIMLNYSAL